jgi:hypothetical protein
LDSVLVVGEHHLAMVEVVRGRGIKSDEVDKMRVQDKEDIRLIRL